MPVIYVCKQCGHILYKFDMVGQTYYGLPSATEIIRMYGGRCPNCNRSLEPPTIEDVEVGYE